MAGGDPGLLRTPFLTTATMATKSDGGSAQVVKRVYWGAKGGADRSKCRSGDGTRNWEGMAGDQGRWRLFLGGRRLRFRAPGSRGQLKTVETRGPDPDWGQPPDTAEDQTEGWLGGPLSQGET